MNPILTMEQVAHLLSPHQNTSGGSPWEKKSRNDKYRQWIDPIEHCVHAYDSIGWVGCPNQMIIWCRETCTSRGSMENCRKVEINARSSESNNGASRQHDLKYCLKLWHLRQDLYVVYRPVLGKETHIEQCLNHWTHMRFLLKSDHYLNKRNETLTLAWPPWCQFHTCGSDTAANHITIDPRKQGDPQDSNPHIFGLQVVKQRYSSSIHRGVPLPWRSCKSLFGKTAIGAAQPSCN